jgi:RloB-like protein
MRQSRKIRNQIVPTYSFVVDGETEIWYLQMLKRNERQLKVNIEPKLPQRKSIDEQYKLVTDLSAREYSKVFWIVDLDTIIKESRETQKGKKLPLQTLIEFRKKLQKNYKNVTVIINNPCLEFWLLLHFEKTSKLFDTCDKAEAELKKHLKDYEKTQKYFTKQDNDIYLKLRPLLKTAISNSSGLGEYDLDEQRKAISEMFLLFEADELKQHYESER